MNFKIKRIGNSSSYELVLVVMIDDWTSFKYSECVAHAKPVGKTSGGSNGNQLAPKVKNSGKGRMAGA